MNRKDMLSTLHELDQLISRLESGIEADDEQEAYEALDKIGHCTHAALMDLDEAKKRTRNGASKG